MNEAFNLNTSEVDIVSGGSPRSLPSLILLGPAVLALAAQALADAVREAQASAN